MLTTTTQRKLFVLLFALALVTAQLLPAKVVHAASANAFLSPSGIGVNKNSTLTVGVYENSGTDTVNAASLFIDFPTLYFKVSQSDVRNSSAFPVVAQTSVNNGRIQIDRGAFAPVSGSQLVATIDFHVVASGVAIPINFATSGVTNVITSSTDNSNIYTGGTGANYALYDPIATGTYMVVNGGGAAFSSRYLNNGLTQETAFGDAQSIAVGGNNMMIINSCGAAFASNTPGGHWTQKTACGDAKAIAVGSDGTMMIISGCGAAFASPNISSGWSQKTACGDARAISVGGKNIALINSNFTAYAAPSWNSGLTQISNAGDAVSVSISSGGTSMIISGCGASYAKNIIGPGSWSQKTVCGDTRAITTGGSKIGVINSNFTAYAANSWDQGLSRVSNNGDAAAYSLGDSTPAMLISGCGAAYGSLGLSVDGYNQVTICGDAKKIAG
jgi:hypothetical protein